MVRICEAGALRSRIAAVIAIAMSMSLTAALAALRFLERGEREPHAFRVAIDGGWSEPTRLVWLDGAEPLSLGVPSNLYEPRAGCPSARARPAFRTRRAAPPILISGLTPTA